MSNMRAIPLLLIPLLVGCTLMPNYERPKMALPEQWPALAAAEAAAEAQVPVEWWKSYNDPALTALVEEGLKNNTDLLTAAARVANARAVLGYDEASLYPEIDLQGDATRTRNSGRSSTGSFVPSTKPFNTFDIGAVLSYEIDLWGKLRSATAADRAQLLASKANRDAIRIAVASDIAQSYFNLQALDAQIAVTNSTIKARSGQFGYQQKQYKYGAADGLTLSQAQAELAAAQNTLPVLQQARVEQGSAMAILLGRDPKSLVLDRIDPGKKSAHLPTPPSLPANAPSSLIERRADIAGAEQQLIASNAEIGVARAAYFPTISLSALIGLQSSQLNQLFHSNAQHWQYGGSIAGPILDFGRTSATVEQAQSAKDEAGLAYQQAVRTAFKEVVDALSSTTTTAERMKTSKKQVAALKDGLRIADLRYKEGYSEYLDLLDAERTLYAAQLTEIADERDRLIASVTLYKALGGGWRAEDIKDAEAQVKKDEKKPAPKPEEKKVEAPAKKAD